MLTHDEASGYLTSDAASGKYLRPIRNARDLAVTSRDAWVIDFGLCDESEALQVPVLYDHLRSTVKEDRQANARESYRRLWWRFLEPRRELRSAVVGSDFFLCTPEVSKHRFFARLDSIIAPDGSLVLVALASASAFGILSSIFHVAWAIAAGGRLGVGNDPRYNKGVCFDAYPFPIEAPGISGQIAFLTDRLDAHRKSAIARDDRVTMTGMYNVVEKLRSGEPLTPKERTIHEIAACGVLRDLHDELDRLVAEAYGWPWPMEKEEILERLVALHDERVEEEKRGLVRWLRPEYQIPRFGGETPAATLDLRPTLSVTPTSVAALPAWPGSAVDQLAAISALVSRKAVSPDEASANFIGARRELVVRHLETLALMGEVVLDADGRYQVARKVA